MRAGLRVLLVAVLLLGAGAAAWTLRSTTPAPEPRPRAPEGIRVVVEVDNAGGKSDMARRLTLELRDVGFDVVRYGTAGRSDLEVTVVYDRSGRPGLAEAVRAALGVGVVESAPDSTRLVDVSVLLGRDWPRDESDPGAGATETESRVEGADTASDGRAGRGSGE
jgi:hypothetical protein